MIITIGASTVCHYTIVPLLKTALPGLMIILFITTCPLVIDYYNLNFNGLDSSSEQNLMKVYPRREFTKLRCKFTF